MTIRKTKLTPFNSEAAKAAAASSVPPEQKKPGVPLKLKQIKP